MTCCLQHGLDDPGANRVLELTVIMRVISIAQVTHGEEGCQHWKPP